MKKNQQVKDEDTEFLKTCAEQKWANRKAFYSYLKFNKPGARHIAEE